MGRLPPLGGSPQGLPALAPGGSPGAGWVALAPMPKPKASLWSSAVPKAVDEGEGARQARNESMADLAKVMEAVQRRIADHSDVISPGRVSTGHGHLTAGRRVRSGGAVTMEP